MQQARAQERSQQLEERKASRIKSSESLTEDDADGAKTERKNDSARAEALVEIKPCYPLPPTHAPLELATSLLPRFGRSLRDQRGKKTYQWNTR